MARKLPLNIKLSVATLGLVAVTVLVLSVVNLLQTQKTLREVAQTSLKAMGDSIYRDFEIQNASTMEKVSSDLVLMDQEINRMGLLNVDPDQKTPTTITNQITGAKETMDLPLFQAGRQSMRDPLIVDSVVKLVGGSATIFQYMPGKLIRVSTTVKRADGTRATLTYIPEDSPVYKSIMEDKVYQGRAYVVNAWYLTAYKPLKSIMGDLLGAAYVGRPILNDAVSRALTGANIDGKGFAFACDAKGSILVHPDKALDGKNITEIGLSPDILKMKEGFVRFTENGVPTTAYVRYYAPWDWFVVVGMSNSDMLRGADMQAMKTSAIAAVVMLALAGLLALIIIRVVSAPLVSLEAYTKDVAGGNFKARLDYEANDAVGHTIAAVHAMVGEIKNKLGFSQGVLDGVSFSSPCLITDPEDKVSFTNKRLLDLLGKPGTPESYVGQPIGQFLLGDPSRGRKTMAKVRAERHLVSEMEYDCHDGTCKTMTANTSMIYDLDGRELGAITLYFDLTHIRAQEVQLKAKNEQIARVAEQAGQIADQVSSAAQQLSAQVEQATRGAEQQSGRAAETATAMEQMNATVLEVAKNATEAANNAEKAREKARGGADSVREVISAISQVEHQTSALQADMGSLGQQAEGIGNIIGVINDIADQTNLLALNAAIEAARAGDAGRGFAVVADEVRKLAEKTMTATKEVGQAVAAIQQGTQKSIAATQSAAESVTRSTSLAEGSGRVLGEIVGYVENTAGQVSSIATAAEEQSATSEEINRAIDDINRISGETAQGMSQSAQAVADLARQAHDLQVLIEEMKA
ncbi:methyl-accepting chemotaxis sensory transducer [Desulfovibrio sp. X2]|uniref:methyl-accepting chemotaxis protein n=1 Tax=Desulfovibrio sp. X2 TaxID=941449 RepID=UPI000358C48D|nr:Cache 3/Cache 2 fusion domain-containing protein [Desulfovibrio sp. X2]EPR41582.1 methyl-accepting chemotaxis sensory transducer [Desulfovibrio sp. X2]